MLALRVECDQGVKLYTPIVQIDFQKYLSGRKKLHAENIIGTFNAFMLPGRSTLKAHILFSQEETSEKYPYSSWESNSYTFRLFLNKSSGGRALEVYQTGPIQITASMLSDYKSGNGFSLCPNRVISV